MYILREILEVLVLIVVTVAILVACIASIYANNVAASLFLAAILVVCAWSVLNTVRDYWIN